MNIILVRSNRTAAKSVHKCEHSHYIPLMFVIVAIGSVILVFAVLARLVPDASRPRHAEARTSALLPMSRVVSGDTFAADEAEVGTARRPTRHVVAALAEEYLLLAVRALLVVLLFSEILEAIARCGCLTDVIPYAHNATAVIATPAIHARMAPRAIAPHHTHAFLAKKHTADDPAAAVTMLAIHTLLHRHGILFHFLRPRLTEVVVEKIPECPDVQLLFAPHRRVLVFVLEGGVELRHDAVAGASIADSRASYGTYPTWHFFKFVLAAKSAFEALVGHGDWYCRFQLCGLRACGSVGGCFEVWRSWF